MYRSLMILVAIMLIFYAVVPAVSAGSQTWYFTTENASAPIYSGADYNKIMKKGVEGGNTVITLEPGQRVWFFADELAACNVTFPAGKWNVAYWVKALNESEAGEGRVYTRIGYIDAEGNEKLVSSSSASEAITNPQDLEEIVEDWFKSNNVESFTVPEGGRLAVEVYWGSKPLGNLEIYCNPSYKHASNMTSPLSDPGYPTSPTIEPIPEFTTIAIPIAIVLGLMFLFRRRKQKS